MRIEIDLPDEMINPSLRSRVGFLRDADLVTAGEREVWRQVWAALEPPLCGARWEHSPWRVEVECDLHPGHDGTHRAMIEDGDGKARIRWGPAPCTFAYVEDGAAMPCSFPGGHDGPHSWVARLPTPVWR